MNVILVNTPAAGSAGVSHIEGISRQLKPDVYRWIPLESLGLMSIKAYAESRLGLSIDVVNGITSGHRSAAETWANMEDIARRRGVPSVVGFSTIAAWEETFELASRVREKWKSAFIVLGNNFATLNHLEISARENCFDFICIGEGEQAFVDLIAAWRDGVDLARVGGIGWRDEKGHYRFNSPTAVDLDALPWPARDELAVTQARGFAPAIFTSRGCPFRCTFCGTGAISGMSAGSEGYRSKSIENVVSEIEFLHNQFGIQHYNIVDDLFLTSSLASKTRAMEFAELLIKRKLDRIEFMMDARVDSIDREVFTALKRAGLRRVFIGIETGSEPQLIAYGKRYVERGIEPVEQINLLKELGITVIAGMITWHPTVTPEELRQSLRMVENTGFNDLWKLHNRLVAYAGTPLYRQLKETGLLTDSWPRGEWHFKDPRAQIMYDKLGEQLRQQPTMCFEQGRNIFLELLEDWETELEGLRA